MEKVQFLLIQLVKLYLKLKFDGLELGGFNGYPNPGITTLKKNIEMVLKEKMTNWGLSFSGFAQDLVE